jgi:hypothetical protein
MDPDFQSDIDRRLLHLLDAYDVKYSTLTGSVEARLDALLSALDE